MHKDILSGFNIYMIPISRSALKTRDTPDIHSIHNLGFIFLVALVCSLSFTCCTSSARKIEVLGKDSTIIILPAPAYIANADKTAFGIACEGWYDSVLGKNAFNGAILVAKGGNIVFEKFRGAGHIGSDDSITNHTAFNIASVSKTITAMAILKLWQDGKLNIDEEFSKYFPNFNYPGVTVRTLLNHRSGLPNYLYFMEDLGWNKSLYIKNQDVFDYLVNRKTELKNIGTPNKRFTYCNTNYALLALLTEKLTGLPFPEFIQKEFFTPLNMKHSFVFTLADSINVNPSYDWRGQMIPLNFLDLVYGDKNVYTTAEDLLIWERALKPGIIFSAATLEQAYMPYSNEKAGIRNYGLGWRMNVYPNGKKMIYHNGWWHGYNAAFIRLIDEDATIIVMGNRYTKAIYKAKDLAGIFGSHYISGEEDDRESINITDTAKNQIKIKRKRR